MYKTHILIFIYFICINCTAQTIDMYSEKWERINGAYYKDLTGFSDQYIGTWLYTNGTTSFKIIIQKKEHMYWNDGYQSCYSDALYGAYQYIENGVEKINNLNNLNSYADNNFFILKDISSIFFNHIIRPNFKPLCPDCQPNELRMKMSFKQPSSNNAGMIKDNRIVLRRYFENGIEKLKAFIFYDGLRIIDEDAPSEVPIPTIPYGEYILIKQ